MKYILSIVIAFVGVVFSGFVFKTGWGWFIVPKFGLPHLSIVEALGVIWTAAFVNSLGFYNVSWPRVKAQIKSDQNYDDSTLNLIYSIGVTFVMYPLSLLSAWIYTLFM